MEIKIELIGIRPYQPNPTNPRCQGDVRLGRDRVHQGIHPVRPPGSLLLPLAPALPKVLPALSLSYPYSYTVCICSPCPSLKLEVEDSLLGLLSSLLTTAALLVTSLAQRWEGTALRWLDT